MTVLKLAKVMKMKNSDPPEPSSGHTVKYIRQRHEYKGRSLVRLHPK